MHHFSISEIWNSGALPKWRLYYSQGWAIFGIDQRYFVTGMHGDLDFVIMMKNYLKHFKGHSYFSNEDGERKFMLIEERLLGCFKQLLAKVIAELKQQLEHATQSQSKILSGISTAAFTLITFVFNYLQRTHLEGHIHGNETHAAGF